MKIYCLVALLCSTFCACAAPSAPAPTHGPSASSQLAGKPYANDWRYKGFVNRVTILMRSKMSNKEKLQMIKVARYIWLEKASLTPQKQQETFTSSEISSSAGKMNGRKHLVEFVEDLMDGNVPGYATVDEKVNAINDAMNLYLGVPLPR